ncbi:type VI secretion system tube protein TssD [Erwinia persicina]|uniref:type VI secretion system tube protein TssD n=1 Tax=Erwinia persicina TaxID=55211 RepID=UPI000E81643B|nr:type VI secretion system tube protein TssD [Erwinia persicina]MBD8167648.1 type VI secretion system tube protein Hcp [Erwinia persicina]HBT53039.1 type VI secretion system tube protein Hcp [Erwinia persicina]
MAIPVYMYIHDDAGNLIKGSVDIHGRENSVEVLGLHHEVYLPTDDLTGEIVNTRKHLAYLVEKEIDSSSSYLYKAVTSGRRLKQVELKFFKINDAGYEVEYFNTLLENVRVKCILPLMHDIKDTAKENFNHMEIVGFIYEKISWKYVDGNIIHSDSWNQRKTA